MMSNSINDHSPQGIQCTWMDDSGDAFFTENKFRPSNYYDRDTHIWAQDPIGIKMVEIFYNILTCSKAEFVNFLKDPSCPKINHCFHAVVKAGNIEVLKHICEEYLCNKHTCNKKECYKDHEMVNIRQRIVLHPPAKPDSDSSFGYSTDIFSARDGDYTISALELALQNQSINPKKTQAVLELLVEYGADLNPQDLIHTDPNEADDEISPVDSEEYYYDDEGLEKHYYLNPLLYELNKTSEVITFLMRNGAKRNYMYSKFHDCLIKQELAPNRNLLYKSVKQKIRDERIFAVFALKQNLPTELATEIVSLIVSRTITPFHRQLSIAKSILRESKKKEIELMSPEELAAPHFDRIALTLSQARERREYFANLNGDFSSKSASSDEHFDADLPDEYSSNGLSSDEVLTDEEECHVTFYPVEASKPEPVYPRLTKTEKQKLAMDIHLSLFKYVRSSDVRR